MAPAESVVSGPVGRRVDVDDLVDTTGIAERLGLSGVQTVHVWIRRYADGPNAFPAPVALFGPVRVWAWGDIERWAKRTGRR